MGLGVGVAVGAAVGDGDGVGVGLGVGVGVGVATEVGSGVGVISGVGLASETMMDTLEETFGLGDTPVFVGSEFREPMARSRTMMIPKIKGSPLPGFSFKFLMFIAGTSI